MFMPIDDKSTINVFTLKIRIKKRTSIVGTLPGGFVYFITECPKIHPCKV